MRVTSPAFADGDTIPTDYTCDGADLSPALAWTGLPAETASLALVLDDPDAPSGVFTHWLAWDLDPSGGGLAPGEAPPREGRNDFGTVGYRGPCPPRGHGTHRYYFRLYALDTAPSVPGGASREIVDSALAGHVLETAVLMGRYERL